MAEEKKTENMEKKKEEIVETKDLKVDDKIVEIVEEEIKDKIPETPETATEEKKEAAAEKVAEEVVEEIKEDKIADAKKEVEKVVKEKSSEDDRKKKERKPVTKKDEAVATGVNLHISKKHAMYICNHIKNKEIDNAIVDLEKVGKFKKIIVFKGEIPHRKGKGVMSGRYPVKAAGLFINILKGLKGNVSVNGMELDKTKIYFASASWAARPMRSRRRQGKRTNVILKAKETTTFGKGSRNPKIHQKIGGKK